ncbi:hypothetical protein LX64_04067 [Chitinophaga skermanii]|uniref:Outer membrane protein with beta-barrel domain n=2 Tax=Chitinophaga skermanii TaxID=331697 RepID=A0A327Q900_9BACT|nr:hypothetical protein LX64_04067 [Chitinophaga skermanii]
MLIFGVMLFVALQSNAQKRNYSNSSVGNYNTAIGVRVNPWSIGFTAKHFIAGPHAIEGIVSHQFAGYDNANVTITGLYEYHWNVFGKKEWNMFAGGGLHGGAYKTDYWDNGRRKDGDTKGVFGLDAIWGVEYTFKNIPLTLQGDLKPYVNFTGGHDYYGEQIFGASARFTF